ncbi:hypothetical protein EV702DRAFT_487685 [Suillus placidus]|uniref:Uncharacterized protein n=1 Tax=Suillus placidus TaxID=48579 RepID=A0A9P7A3S7_9AGAM|nr:hypothetical protein EV702DRAFT_487685 [Suillus placidus]
MPSYKFQRTSLKIVVTETKAKEVHLDSSKIPKTFGGSPEFNLQEALHRNIPVSKSGRTLQEILSLSCNDLKTYIIDKVRPGVWGQSMTVKYHHNSQTKTPEDHLKETQSLKIGLEDLLAEVQTLKAEQEAQKAEWEAQRDTMEKWQAANDVFQSLGEIAWSEMSAERKNQLRLMDNINDFTELFYHYRTSAPAKAAYMSIDADIHRSVEAAIKLKREVQGDQSQVAHPNISMARLQSALDELDIKDKHLRTRLISMLHTKV